MRLHWREVPMSAERDSKLAIDGGDPAITQPLPLGSFGLDLIGAEEEEFVLQALRRRTLCRVSNTFEDSFIEKFEDELRRRSGSPYAIALNSGASALHV